MPKAGESIPGPQKKMPTGANEPPTEVRIITPSVVTPAATPALEVAPTVAPGLDADNRNPF
jgi:hypothetical protein